jgi:hypothetical protein
MFKLERIGFLASAQEEAVIVLPWKEEYNELIDNDHFIPLNDLVKPVKPFLLLVAQHNFNACELLYSLADTAICRKYIATDNYLFAITYQYA